jgi:hypothetical protein
MGSTIAEVTSPPTTMSHQTRSKARSASPADRLPRRAMVRATPNVPPN